MPRPSGLAKRREAPLAGRSEISPSSWLCCCGGGIVGACPLASDWLTPPSWIKERSQESTRSKQIAALLAEIGRRTPRSGLVKHGYYAIRNGWLHLDVLGTDKVRQLWSGTTEVDLDRLIMNTSKSKPETTFISKAACPATATAPPLVDRVPPFPWFSFSWTPEGGA